MAGVMLDNKAVLGGDIGVSTYGTMPDRPHQGRGYWKEARVYHQYSSYVHIGNNLFAHFPGQFAEGRPRAGTSLSRAVVRILCIPVLTSSVRVARVAGVDVTYENEKTEVIEIEDSEKVGKIFTIDIIPHNKKLYWNCIDDCEGKKTSCFR